MKPGIIIQNKCLCIAFLQLILKDKSEVNLDHRAQDQLLSIEVEFLKEFYMYLNMYYYMIKSVFQLVNPATYISYKWQNLHFFPKAAQNTNQQSPFLESMAPKITRLSVIFFTMKYL